MNPALTTTAVHRLTAIENFAHELADDTGHEHGVFNLLMATPTGPERVFEVQGMHEVGSDEWMEAIYVAIPGEEWEP